MGAAGSRNRNKQHRNLLAGRSPTGADIENMEGAALFALCAEFGADCCQIRAISNTVGENRSGWRVKEAVTALHETLYKTICR